MKLLCALALCALPLADPAAAQNCGGSFVESFTDQSNIGAWGWTGTFQGNIASGGNPGYWVRSSALTTPLPIFYSQDPLSPFGGDWRAADVSSVGVDLFAVDLDPGQCSRPLSLELYSDAGTPGSQNDDRAVRFVSALAIPCKDGDWRSYGVDVPSQSPALPAGWSVSSSGGLPLGQVWDAVIQDVTRVTWYLGNPGIQYFAYPWTLGADNARIAFAGGPTSYCIAQHNSLGCSPAIAWIGSPSASQPIFFRIDASQVKNQSVGILFYGYGPQQAPFLGGYVCASAPIWRTPPQVSGGSPSGIDCSGSFDFEFNVYAQSGVDPGLVPGSTPHVQYWSRDVQAASGSSLSNAMRFVLCP